ncbi:hypothetical protein PCH_Pc22g14310 [Penicillium rubens Wisconsin 54-1255]|uniref:Uncharacterized protein n=1 Tax=Penicillium rubens (strain ATCC 28089 / DSM 1075 / NRRL 1951 / Wisconsin 54-1255) TaxID=500485 RepID=B6HUJ6_PENRW|nr:hypothetical protein PCH_Pc22g14310 [Penicillium rubens Wisconsin 54-1255]
MTLVLSVGLKKNENERRYWRSLSTGCWMASIKQSQDMVPFNFEHEFAINPMVGAQNHREAVDLTEGEHSRGINPERPIRTVGNCTRAIGLARNTSKVQRVGKSSKELHLAA